MTNQEFLSTFQKHLLIAAPKRVELLAEVKSHLEERSSENIGDPKKLATDLNRIHIGPIHSFRQLLLLRLVTFAVFEFGWLALYLHSAAGISSPGQPWWSHVLTISAQFVPVVVFIYGAYIIAHLHRRWVEILAWGGTFALGGTLIQLWEEASGYLLSVDAAGNQNSLMSAGGQFLTMWLVFGTIALGLMVALEGKNILWPKHRILATVAVFLLMGIASYFVIPLTWQVISGFHYTEAMVPVDVWIFNNQHYLAFGVGIFGGALEWFRHSRMRDAKK